MATKAASRRAGCQGLRGSGVPALTGGRPTLGILTWVGMQGFGASPARHPQPSRKRLSPERVKLRFQRNGACWKWLGNTSGRRWLWAAIFVLYFKNTGSEWPWQSQRCQHFREMCWRKERKKKTRKISASFGGLQMRSLEDQGCWLTWTSRQRPWHQLNAADEVRSGVIITCSYPHALETCWIFLFKSFLLERCGTIMSRTVLFLMK